jgi:hypothetical protein
VPGAGDGRGRARRDGGDAGGRHEVDGSSDNGLGVCGKDFDTKAENAAAGRAVEAVDATGGIESADE